MVKTSLLKRQAKVYLKIAHRQIAMAEALLEKGFYEGAVFHCYHTLEAACSAGIANKDKRCRCLTGRNSTSSGSSTLK